MKAPAEYVGVVQTGARTALGLTATTTAAAVRAGIAAFGEHPTLDDREGEPLIVARVPTLAAEVGGLERFVQLASPPALEALVSLQTARGRKRPVPVVVGLPAARPGLPKGLAQGLAEALARQLNEVCPIAGVETLCGGHSAGLMALDLAVRNLRSGGAEFCLVGGVDTYLEPESLAWLEECEQIHGASQNAWGFVPGEGAGFCLLCLGDTAEQYSLSVSARVLAVGTTQEDKLIKTEAVCLGQGLTAAFRHVLQELPSDGERVDHVLCDMNGETYRADEFGFTAARTSERFVNMGGFQAPADCWGDVGAASGPLYVNLVATAYRKGYAKGPYTLLWSSSEGGERSAALLHTDSPRKRRSP